MDLKLRDTKIVDVLILVTADRPDFIGRLRLYKPVTGQTEGELYVEGRAVVGAVFDEAVGRHALYRMLDYEGNCETEPLTAIPDDRRNMHYPLAIARLEEIAKTRRANWTAIQQRIPTNDAIPVPDRRFDRTLTWTLRDWQWRALMRMDGSRSIAEIARRAEIDELSVCQFILELQEKGLLMPEIKLPALYRASLVRLLLATDRKGGSSRGRLSEPAQRLIKHLRAEDRLSDAAERAKLDPRTAALAAVELIRTGNVAVAEGEVELSQLAEE